MVGWFLFRKEPLLLLHTQEDNWEEELTKFLARLEAKGTATGKVALIKFSLDFFCDSFLQSSFPQCQFHKFYFTQNEDDSEAAKNLFAMLREIDEHQGYDLILVDMPEKNFGLWPAINDRLARAASRF